MSKIFNFYYNFIITTPHKSEDYKIAYNVINNKERPNYLSRSNKSTDSLDELVKSKITRFVKDNLC